MARKKKVSLSNSPHYQAAFNQAKMQAAAGRAQRAQNAKNIRKQGWQMAKEGLYDGIVQNSIDVIDGAVSGAMKAFGPGDKKTMLKGAIEGVADTHAVKKALNALGKVGKGVAKGILNDLSWYNNYPESTLEMIGPNFNVRNGIYEPLYDLNSDNYVKMGLPSAAAVWVRMVRGDDTEDAVSTSMNRIFTAIRQANSGNVNWAPYQMDAYLFTYRQIIALYAVTIRGLKYLNKFSVTDKGIPQSLFAAMGLDYDDFAQNSAEIRNYLTNFKVRMSGFAIPKFDILKRTQWLFSNGFYDSDDIKHQTYFMCPYIYQYYNTGSNALSTFNSGWQFTPTTLSSSQLGRTWSTIKSMLDTLMKELLANDVYSIISGDVVKAYGVEPLFKLETVPEVGTLPDEGYSEEVLQQIQNAYIARAVNGGSAIVQTLTHANTADMGLTETLTYVDSTYQTNPTYANAHTLVNMYKNGISNLDVLGATRFISFVSNDGANYTIESYGTEIFEQLEYFYFNYGTNNVKYKVAKVISGSIVITDFTTPTNIELASLPGIMWSAFDWSPRQIQKLNCYDSNGTSKAYMCQTLFDINNYAKIDTIDQLRAIHNVATQSLYYSPLLSKINNNVVDYSN